MIKTQIDLIFATSNPHKLMEARNIIPHHYRIRGLSDIGYIKEIPETTGTIEGNALQKANTLYKELNINCFSEDTGLEIFALDGRPGVDTAYYGGPERDANKNIAKVLAELSEVENRSARFRTVIALILDHKQYTFEGIVNGQILNSPVGDGGFGYDPIFKPDGYEFSFGELASEIKNEISHRARAMKKLIDFLENNESKVE